MRVEKREFALDFCQLPCAGQTRKRVDQSMMFTTGQTRAKLRVDESLSHQHSSSFDHVLSKNIKAIL
jgi:hypothetical protein